jgi:hypothetical protein
VCSVPVQKKAKAGRKYSLEFRQVVHLTLTEWKPIPRIYPMRTIVRRAGVVNRLRIYKIRSYKIRSRLKIVISAG